MVCKGWQVHGFESVHVLSARNLSLRPGVMLSTSTSAQYIFQEPVHVDWEKKHRNIETSPGCMLQRCQYLNTISKTIIPNHDLTLFFHMKNGVTVTSYIAVTPVPCHANQLLVIYVFAHFVTSCVFLLPPPIIVNACREVTPFFLLFLYFL